ncbi:MAG: metallophosphoesterase [Bacteriovoracia bacterium]
MRFFSPILCGGVLACLIALPGVFFSARANPPGPTTAPDGVAWKFARNSRVVAIGDLHGDANALLDILTQTKLIDKAGNWIGGDAHLVLTGDLVDRGPDSRIILQYLIGLSRQAEAAGGHVHRLLGNHEFMLATGDTFYTHADDFKGFATVHPAPEARQSFLLAMNDVEQSEIAREARGRNAVIQIGDTIFAHAGIGDWAEESATPANMIGEVNARIRKNFSEYQDHTTREIRAQKILPAPTETYWGLGVDGPLEDTRLTDRGGSTPEIDAKLREILRSNGAKEIAVGHRVTESRQIRRTHAGQVVHLDTAISVGMDSGQLTAYEITATGEKTFHQGLVRSSKPHPVVVSYRKLDGTQLNRLRCLLRRLLSP